MPGSSGEPLEDPAPARAAKAQPGGGICDQRRERPGQRPRILRRHQMAVGPVVDQLRHRRHPAGDDRELRCACFEQDVGQAVAIAIRRDPARQHEQIRPAIGIEHLILRQGATPHDPVGEAEARRRAGEPLAERAAADVLVAPVHVRRQHRQRLEQDLDALLRHEAGDAEQAHRSRRVAGHRAPAPASAPESAAASSPW